MIAIRCDYLYDVNGLCFILLLQSHCSEYKALIQQVRNKYCIYCISQKTSGVLRLMPCFISFTETLASHMAFTQGIYHFSTTILLVFSTMGRRTFRCMQYSKQTKTVPPFGNKKHENVQIVILGKCETKARNFSAFEEPTVNRNMT